MKDYIKFGLSAAIGTGITLLLWFELIGPTLYYIRVLRVVAGILTKQGIQP